MFGSNNKKVDSGEKGRTPGTGESFRKNLVDMIKEILPTDDKKKRPGRDKYVEIPSRGNSLNKGKQDNAVRTSTPSDSKPRNTRVKIRELEDRVLAILNSDEEKLTKEGLPTKEELSEKIREGRKLRDDYECTNAINALYVGECGIRDNLNAIVDTAQYIPDGARLYNSEKQRLPLYVYVYSTTINTIERDFKKLEAQYNKLGEEPTEVRTAELISKIETAYSEWRGARYNPEKEKKLTDAVNEYKWELTTAEEMCRDYAFVTERKGKAERLYKEIKTVLESPEFKALGTEETPEYHGSELKNIEMDGENVQIDAATEAYWKKVCTFAGFFAYSPLKDM